MGIHAFVLLLISVIKLLVDFTIIQDVLQNFPLNFELRINSQQITVYFGRPIMFLVFFWKFISTTNNLVKNVFIKLTVVQKLAVMFK